VLLLQRPHGTGSTIDVDGSGRLGMIPRRAPAGGAERRRARRTACAAAFAILIVATFAHGADAVAGTPGVDVPIEGVVLAQADAPTPRESAPPTPPASSPAAAASGERAARATADRPEAALARPDYALPALEIVGFQALLNRANRYFGTGRDDYRVTLDSIRRNLRSGWGTDRDPFNVNQFGHPYQGAMYHGFARSAGFDYWRSLGYAFAGSIVWEIAGEQTRPSRNDQVASGIGGTFLGEALFRMSSLVLEHGGGMPRVWREVAATAIAPSAGFNRLVFGERYGDVYSSRGAAYFSELQLGYAGSVKRDLGTSTAEFRRHEAQLGFSIDYGLPGSDGYTYQRPFDYFNFRATLSSANGIEAVLTRGLLLGRTYELGREVRGVWGLYGSYDYIAPQTFRVSTTALSLGTTAQAWLGAETSLQGTAMAGLGYAAVGTTHGSTTDRDYNYGVAPQALLNLRVVHGDKIALNLTGREYFVSRVGSGTPDGRDNIVRGDATLTWRLAKQHAVSIRVAASRRDAEFQTGRSRQSQVTVGLFYTLLGRDRFGTVDWR
jgi:hypothetical protein